MKLIAYFMREYPIRSGVMLCCLLFSGVADGVGLMTMLPILNALISKSGDVGSTIHSVFIGSILSIIGLKPSLSILLLLMLGVVYTKAVLLLFAMRQAGYTVAHVTNNLRIRLIRALMEANWPYYISRPSGYFSNAIGTEAMRAAMAYHHAILMIAAIVQVIVYGLIALTLSWRITLIAFVVGFLMLYLLRGLIKMSREAGNSQTLLMRSLITRLTDALQGIKPLKAMALEKNIQSFLESDSENLNLMQRKSVFASELVNSLQEPLMATMVATGVYFLFDQANGSLPAMLLLVFLFSKLLQRFYYAQRCYQEVGIQESALWAILESISTAEAEKEVGLEKGTIPQLNSAITFDNVSFSYAKQSIFRGMSFKIKRGTFVAIIGPSGAGKTTLIDLLVGLFVPVSGSIRLDDIPLSNIDLKEWRGMIGYVPQEMLLFHDTIYNNITLGDNEISHGQVEQALRRADAWEFVVNLPAGLNSSVGERGAKLSGGQRQRLSIARALVRNPALLILDEVTTALDPVAENEICLTLRNLSGQVTILAISHQKAMINFADCVYQLIDGTLLKRSDVMG